MWTFLGKPFRWLAQRALIDVLRRAGNGEYGVLAQRVYWAAATRKRLVGAVCGYLAGLAFVAGEPTLAGWLGVLSMALVGAGLADRGLRHDARPLVADTWWYRALAPHGPQLATLAVGALAWLQSADCTPVRLGEYALSCSTMFGGALAVAVAGAYVGLYDIGLLTPAPLSDVARRAAARWPRGPAAPGPGPAALIAAALLLPALTSCGSAAQLQIGRGLAVHPDRAVVRSYVCAGHEDAARLYLDDPAYAWLGPARERYLTDARDARLRGECPCPAPGCPQAR